MTKYCAIAFVAALVSVAMFSPAEARGGCGIGRHRGPLGICVNDVAGPAVVVAPRGAAVVVRPAGKVCAVGWHLGPNGHCRRN